MAQLDGTLVRIEYEINGEYLNFANQKSSDPATITIVTDKADVPVVTKSAPQRTETPQNSPSRTKDQDIHWQVAVKAAVDLKNIDNSDVMVWDDEGEENNWYEQVVRISTKLYNIIEAGPQPIAEGNEPDPVEDLGDDDDTQAVMEV